MTAALPEWVISPGLTPYPDALAAMEARVEAIQQGRKSELIWLVEHPPLYTGGTSARAEELLEPNRLPVYQIGRGGRYTYHGPGQRVVYVMLDLSRRGQDLRSFVSNLEKWIISCLAEFGIEGRTIEGKVGVWVKKGDQHAKIAALGIRVKRWVSFHGISINIDPDMGHYSGIQACGLDDPVTSLHQLNSRATMAMVDDALRRLLPDMLLGLTAPTFERPVAT